MSTNIPKTIPEFIAWCGDHADSWQMHQAQIGLSAGQVAGFKALVEALETADAAATAARTASKDATIALRNNLDATRATAAAYVAVIKAFAESTNNPNVYSLASISPDDPRSTLPPPLPPESFVATVNPSGSIKLTWKVSQPAGVSNIAYMVKRKIPGVDTAFTTIGSAGKKEFTDETLPVGVDAVQYIVQPRRGESIGGESNVLALQFGSVGGGGGSAFGITSTTTMPNSGNNSVKMAA
ncbi:MAG: hypothetical protein IT438_06370 [Phycisphaerales bacterium]|nr:hypothetical protein [Phycisphaerales bacterium]